LSEIDGIIHCERSCCILHAKGRGGFRGKKRLIKVDTSSGTRVPMRERIDFSGTRVFSILVFVDPPRERKSSSSANNNFPT
jgi:hypothetical protein